MDIRIERFAKVLVGYSLAVQPGDWVTIRGESIAQPMIKAIYQEVLLAGGHPQVNLTPSWQTYTFLKHANDEQLDFISPITRAIYEEADVSISILSSSNTKALSNLDPARRQRRARATTELREGFMKRAAEGSLRWMATIYPTQAFAQDAEMSLEEYEDFVYGAALVNDTDAVKRWHEVSQRQQRLVDWLKGHEEMHIKGANADLRFSIKERLFMNADGHRNFPDGEIFTGPVEESVNGWVRFTYPAIIQGREVSGIEFTFKDGKVVEAKAKKNQDALLKLLDTDAGSRYLGEVGIGTNPGITRFTHNLLFDEKIQGTFHLAVGASYPETGGKNKSTIHQDIVCDLNDGEIIVDGEVFYRHGDFVI
jgi:aminopeptidase